jgi:hypothetical protein
MNQQQITITRGDSRTLDFSDVEDADGVAYDLNDVTAISFKVNGLFEKTLDDFDIDESAGDLMVDVEPADTTDAPDQRHAYRYDLALTLTGDVVRTVRHGLFIVTPDIDAM